jgi:hypothetical protein
MTKELQINSGYSLAIHRHITCCWKNCELIDACVLDCTGDGRSFVWITKRVSYAAGERVTFQQKTYSLASDCFPKSRFDLISPHGIRFGHFESNEIKWPIGPHGSSDTINSTSNKDHSKCVRNESALNRLSLQPHLASSAKGTQTGQYENSLSPSVVSLPSYILCMRCRLTINRL